MVLVAPAPGYCLPFTLHIVKTEGNLKATFETIRRVSGDTFRKSNNFST